MSDPEIFRILSTVSFIGSTVLIAMYAPTSWWRNEFGRSFMALVTSVWLFTLASSLRQWLGENYTGRTEVRLAAQIVLVGSVWYIVFILLRAARGRRK